jgi:hypothetical protein
MCHAAVTYRVTGGRERKRNGEGSEGLEEGRGRERNGERVEGVKEGASCQSNQHKDEFVGAL